MARRRKRKSRSLVLGFLERISSDVFSDFPKELTNLVVGQSGVYSLYKNDRLYYVGLASNLRNRIKQHLKDKHKGQWNRFSLYLVRKADHIRELEAIILRAANPTGNPTTGRLKHATDLRKKLEKNIASAQKEHRFELFGLGKRISRVKRNSKWKRSKPSESLQTGKRFQIRAKFNGKEYKAVVLQNGMIEYKGTRYSTPTAAAKAITGVATLSGWMFWKFKKRKNKWVKLSNLK